MHKRQKFLQTLATPSMLGQRKGDILVSNVIFIILNLVFITILILFVFSKTGNEALLEEKYAKEIALMIDSAKPDMKIHLNMEDALETSRKNGFDEKNIVSVNGNIVTVKLRDKGGYSYSFFNDVSVSAFQDNQMTNEYVIIINNYN